MNEENRHRGGGPGGIHGGASDGAQHPGGGPGGHPGGHPGGGKPGGEVDSAALTDLTERGANGATFDRRLYMQLLVFSGATESEPLVAALKESGMESVLYEDVNDPEGVGLLTMSEDENHFIDVVRPFLKKSPFAELILDTDFTMMGRSYTIGHEENIEDWLLEKWKRSVNNPERKWAVWYPVRRTGAFNALEPREQGMILREHGMIGRAFGDAGLAADVRLASFGLDKNDNDFTIGLIGDRLLPLSKLVQTMRKTKQTSGYVENLGPFFIGRALYQSGA